MLGMKVVDLDGNRITFMKAFIRSPIGKILSGIILGNRPLRLPALRGPKVGGLLRD